MSDVSKLCMGCMEAKGEGSVCGKCGYKEGSEPESLLHLRPGTELHGQYVIGRVLGHGGFGVTYLGWDLNLERKLAIKEYLPSGVAMRTGVNSEVMPFSGETRKDFEYGLERYLDEARTVARFQTHPSVVSVLNFFRANGTAYLVMEYLEGATFERFLESHDGKTSMDTVMTVMVPVLEALGAVHQQGILHRDISPDNVYITRKWQVKVLDFGAARYALGQKSRNLSVILKEGYAPIEQYHSKGNQGPWTDVYACAATMYRALTGKVPPASLERMQTDELRPPGAAGVEISPLQEAALLKALAVQPEKRFHTMQAFQDALTGVVASVSETGEKIPALSQGGFPSGVQGSASQMHIPTSVAPQQPTVRSGDPAAGPIATPSGEPRPSRRDVPKPSLPKWVWGAAAGMLIAMLGIGGYKTWEDHKRAIEAEKQREIQRIKNEEEMKRQQALLAELEKRRVERLEEERKWKEKQDELERQRRELEERTKQLEMQRQKNSKSQPVLEELKRLKEQKQQNEDQFQQLLKQQLQQQMGQNQGDNRQNQNAFNQGQQGQGQQSQQGQPGQKQGSQGQVWQSWQNSNQGTGQGYDDLLRQAANLSRSRNYNGAIQVNQQAIRANSARPDAYANIGWIALYGTGDMGLAMSHYKEAIQRGGMVYFRVMHDHQQMSFQDRCEGNLGIARDHLQYTSSNGIHNLKLSKAEIGEIRENKLPFRRVSGDFHIKAADGRNFNLLPVSNARLVRDMILQLASLK